MTAPRRRRAAARPAPPPGALSLEVTPAPPAEGSVLSPFAAPVRPSAATTVPGSVPAPVSSSAA